MKNRITALTVLLYTFAGLPSAFAAGTTAQIPTVDTTGFLVSADWVKANADKVILFDARTKAEYEKEHIAGAVQKHWRELSNVAVKQGEPGWSVILGAQQLAQILATLGVDGTKPVVFYNDPLAGWGEEAHNLWVFRILGIKNSYILNGGLTAWKKAGGGVNNQPVAVKAVTPGTFTPDYNTSATTDFIAANLGKIKILDTREKAEYDAQKNYGEKTNGRIPGAKHIFYKDFYTDDGTYKTADQLKVAFAALGFTAQDTVVAYCTGGIRSSVGTLALQIAGFTSVKNYDASYSEWAGTSQRIEK